MIWQGLPRNKSSYLWISTQGHAQFIGGEGGGVGVLVDLAGLHGLDVAGFSHLQFTGVGVHRAKN